MCEKALELDPQYAEAYAQLGWTYFAEWDWSQDPQSMERAFALAQKALARDDSLSKAHLLLAYIYLFNNQKQHELAIAEAERAITLDPSNAEAYAVLGQILTVVGRPEEAIGLAEKAMRLNPLYPSYHLTVLGIAYRWTRRYEEAIAALKRAISANPNYLLSHLILAGTYSELGREGEAQAEAAEVLRIRPNFSLEVWRQRLPFKDPAVTERLLATLRKAGLK